MKRKFFWLIAILSGLYLLVVGPLIDPLPFLDEAAALAVFAFAMRMLGFDVSRWLPFLRGVKGGTPQAGRPSTGPPPVPPAPKTAERDGPVIDV